ncbi:hypothetical protein A2630_03330 [Candidatus Woesebacteria bacterium RIFCSPHIGHO2_01_FULL_44_10]|uniref:Type II secretion system protein GspG C-terminal domain-containing protein n=1 Tax=Candidatus Woesebacteria bacterium RIFCSPLOWO2_01_FULL_44_14 TaxID=1802525 RepID=A0A1F8BXK7_9BACT|nr:MAG: hypothetical protein A2630_03330 [Candidatus Woesebacteria bacterium RIFCSPHIGHO2_01_FULL_44_10]OGM56443.1 MAG: hypothetical protein A3F62_01990 [Candidatus Woesebacteria bacterium RIFCSPHIGHO2_12_FULL_44_11]OGM68844.1 MAG: hypothetical protein A2975_00535 [Candidatus Woesebacteria bacterium RIFCSPLOWO2_01_FULL_44_14]
MRKGFTLIELLVVMSIIGVLVALVAGGFRTAQLRGRDAQRKSDLKQISEALELYFSDYNQYPTSLTWGSEFTDGKTSYFKVLPADPEGAQNYYYRVVDVGTNQKFQLFAHLENSKDQDCLGGNCQNPAVPAGVTCGSGIRCNFAVVSPNTAPTE